MKKRIPHAGISLTRLVDFCGTVQAPSQVRLALVLVAPHNQIYDGREESFTMVNIVLIQIDVTMKLVGRDITLCGIKEIVTLY